MNALSSQNAGSSQRINIINHKKANDEKNIHINKCTKCGRTHKLPHKGNCPAYGTTCRNCGKLNHWQKVCKSGKSRYSSKQPHRSNKRVINSLEEESNYEDPYAEIPTIGTIEINNVENKNNATDATREEYLLLYELIESIMGI